MEMLKRTWAEISLDNLEYNYRWIRNHVPANTKFLGVVKADAYGHGAVEIARHLEKLGAEFLAVATLDEARQLRENGIQRPILILGYTPEQFAVYEAQQEIRQEVGSLEQALQLNAQLEGTGLRLRIHLKLDTGMSRLGFFAYDCPETLDVLEQIAAMPNLIIEGVFQHFCVADSHAEEDVRFTKLQYERFCAMLAAMEQRGIRPEIRHCCNSAATILYPEFAMDMVRPGIATYGYAPDPCMNGDCDLKPLLSLYTTVAQIREFDEDVSVSYGRTWKTSGRRRIAALTIGYADGLNRRLSGNVQFRIHGKIVPQVGRICMDMCMVDITDVPEAGVGDTVTVIEQEGTCSCEKMAADLGTITYEITCGISKRVLRLYR